jgi:capsular polysaccharide biosynthesis protein
MLMKRKGNKEEIMEEEDTIELIDLLRVVWKWKWFIIVFVIVCSLIAGIWSLSLQKVYKVSTMLAVNPESDIIASTNLASDINIAPSTIAANINEGMFNGQIQAKLDENIENYSFLNISFKASNPKNSNMIKITCETKDSKVGEMILRILNNSVIEKYQKKFDRVKKLFLLEEMHKKNIESRIDAISNQIKIIDDMITRENDIKGRGVKDLAGLILLRSSLKDSLLQKEHEVLQVEKSLGQFTLSIEEGGPVKVIQNPISSSKPIKPKIRLNVLLAGFTGFFFSLFLSFFIEYVQKMKNYKGYSSSSTQERPPEQQNE